MINNNNKIISYFQALQSLVPNALLYVEDNDWNRVNWSDQRTQPTKDQADAEVIRMQSEYDLLAYSRARKTAYDALNQFELISDDAINGTTTHKDAIAKVKSDNPKPE